MIFFLYGPDEYRRLKKKNEIIAEFRKKHEGMAVGRFDMAEKDELPKLKDFVESQSLFDPKKLAIIENAFEIGSEADGKELNALLKTAAKNGNITILVSEKNKSGGGLTFLAGKSASVKAQPFTHLEGAKLEAFISELAKENGIELQPQAVKLLASVYQGDAWALATEIAKISALGKKNVGLKDLENLNIETSPDYFGLLQGLKNYEMGARLSSLEKLFAMNEAMPKVFNMIAYQIPGKLGMLAKYDVLVKSGKLDYEEALVDLII